MTHIPSYSDVFDLSHKAASALWTGTVVAQEKCDGSQLSFGVFDGALSIRSKRADINPLMPDGMFAEAVQAIQSIAADLHPGWTYRGEYLRVPKHNTIAYARVPTKHIILFDIDAGNQDYLPVGEMQIEAQRIGLEVVPTLAIYDGVQPTQEQLAAFLTRESVLGGVKTEGVILKNYTVFGHDKKILMAKLVRDDFKEVQRTDWKERNPSGADFVESLVSRYATDARRRKAVEHLRDAGQLQHAPQDIPAVMKEIVEDTLRECGDEIRDALFRHFWPQIARGLNRGAAEWYKATLREGEATGE